VAAIDHPAVGVCLDVGHAAVAATVFGFDYLGECAAVAPLVRHVHLHDNLGRPEPEGGEPRVAERLTYGTGDLHLPPGRGTIPLEELFRRVGFPHDPTVCVELLPGLHPLAKEAVEAARRLGESAGVRASEVILDS
jgi:sugar phosphate isomerase/epimerase